MTTTEREGYSNRLFARLVQLCTQEMPPGFARDEEAWQRTANTEKELMRVAKAYEEGVTDKGTLDTAAANHLKVMREGFAQARKPSRTQAA